MTAIEERAAEEKIALAQQWHDAMRRQVHNIIVSTLEASETMLEEVDPDSDPEELRIELMAAGLNAVAAMGGSTKDRSRVAPPTCRMPLEQSQASPKLIPKNGPILGFDIV